MSGAALGSIIAVIITAHISHSKTMCGQSHTVVIIHADAPCIDPYMSRAMAVIQIHDARVMTASSTITRPPPCCKAVSRRVFDR